MLSWIALAIGLFLIVVGVIPLKKDPRALFRDWPTAPAEILSDTLTEVTYVGETTSHQPSTFRTWQLDVTFSYEIAGVKYIGTRAAPQRIRSLRIFRDGPASPRLLALHAQYAIGSSAIAYVNPANPSQAYLIGWRNPLQEFFPWAAIVAGILIAAIAVSALRRS